MENLNNFEIESLIDPVELPILSENAGDRLSCLFASCNSSSLLSQGLMSLRPFKAAEKENNSKTPPS